MINAINNVCSKSYWWRCDELSYHINTVKLFIWIKIEDTGRKKHEVPCVWRRSISLVKQSISICSNLFLHLNCCISSICNKNTHLESSGWHYSTCIMLFRPNVWCIYPLVHFSTNDKLKDGGKSPHQLTISFHFNCTLRIVLISKQLNRNGSP